MNYFFIKLFISLNQVSYNVFKNLFRNIIFFQTVATLFNEFKSCMDLRGENKKLFRKTLF